MLILFGSLHPNALRHRDRLNGDLPDLGKSCNLLDVLIVLERYYDSFIGRDKVRWCCLLFYVIDVSLGPRSWLRLCCSTSIFLAYVNLLLVITCSSCLGVRRRDNKADVWPQGTE